MDIFLIHYNNNNNFADFLYWISNKNTCLSKSFEAKVVILISPINLSCLVGCQLIIFFLILRHMVIVSAPSSLQSKQLTETYSVPVKTRLKFLSDDGKFTFHPDNFQNDNLQSHNLQNGIFQHKNFKNHNFQN